jgi:uncharacterized protein
MSTPETVDSRVLDDIVQRIVRVASPLRIIVCDSAARGTMGPHSDIDLLVISNHDQDRSQVVGDIYVALHGVGKAVDIIMATPEEVEQYRDSRSLVIHPALKHGKEIYRADALSTQ